MGAINDKFAEVSAALVKALAERGQVVTVDDESEAMAVFRSRAASVRFGDDVRVTVSLRRNHRITTSDAKVTVE